MEILHRDIKSKREEDNRAIRVGLIDGARLSLSLFEKDKDTKKNGTIERKDVVINFTSLETEK